MKAKKILFITQEMTPFVPESGNALFGKNLPKSIQENGHEIRTFTPKWGIINERRNQLHEVIYPLFHPDFHQVSIQPDLFHSRPG